MKLRKMNRKYWELIETKGKLISHRIWIIYIDCPGEKYKWAVIREKTFLYGEFYTEKTYEDKKGKYKKEIYKYEKKKEMQTYIRGLRRNIKEFYNMGFLIKEEFIESEEGSL